MLDGGDDVSYPHRRQPRARPRERQRQRDRAQQPREAIREIVAWPEDHRGLEDRPLQVRAGLIADHAFATALAAQVMAWAEPGIRIERADVQQAVDTRTSAGLDQPAHQLDVHLLEAAPVVPALVQDPDQVDDRPLPGAERRELALVVNVGRDQLERGERAEVAGTGRVARRHGDLPAGAGERRAQVRADETGTAEHAD